ncbi:gas vesicle protein [Neobacillus vireti]|uniref:gas vesicle protein n=2 Tax=Neobacillus vireti TaxID=220686 RepID=UPI003B58B24D
MPIHHTPQSSNLLEVLEKILDKGVVIAGDIKISLADVDLLTIKIRLLVASVDKAREIGMDWWEKDPYYSSKGIMAEKERAQLLERINRLEQLVEKDKLPLPMREQSIAIPKEESSSSSFQDPSPPHLDESSS